MGLTSKWFLPPPKPGSPDAWCFKESITYDLKVYVIVAEYYKRIADLVSSLQKGDEVFIVSWGIFGALDLGGITLQDLLLKAANIQEVKVRILQSRDRISDKDVKDKSNDFVDYLKNLLLSQNIKNNIEYITDLSLVQSHQKAVYIRKKEYQYLFVGGMDLMAMGTYNRIDVQVEVTDFGARDGLQTILERWNDLSPNKIDYNSPYYQNVQVEKNGIVCQLQFVRSYPSQTHDPNSNRHYANNGDFTYYHLISRAIKLANKSIYIEDQFFQQMGVPHSTKNQIIDSNLYDRHYLPELPPSLDHILFTYKQKIPNFVVFSQDYLHSDLFRSIKQAGRYFPKSIKFNIADNPGINEVNLDLGKQALEVHSKTWIFDDEFVLIGSGNYWVNSFIERPNPPQGEYLYAEFGVAIVPISACDEYFGFQNLSFAKALRLRMWERLKQVHNSQYHFDRSKIGNFRGEYNELTSRITLPNNKIIGPFVEI